ncbi:hypothetical protein GSB9_01149 [Flavobacteriaceae bacterium GSB9]|nr:hypothetical protein GSB9_01149 [Flavobacteriaceae bacterium GSB9]
MVSQDLTIVNTNTTAPQKPLSVSKHFYKNIYFDNGSFALDQNAKNHLLSLVEILKTESRATVFIDGNASNVGNKVF